MCVCAVGSGHRGPNMLCLVVRAKEQLRYHLRTQFTLQLKRKVGKKKGRRKEKEGKTKGYGLTHPLYRRISCQIPAAHDLLEEGVRLTGNPVALTQSCNTHVLKMISYESVADSKQQF